MIKIIFTLITLLLSINYIPKYFFITNRTYGIQFNPILLQKIYLNMSQQEIYQILGQPNLINKFNKNEVYYIKYTTNNQNIFKIYQKIKLIFNNKKLLKKIIILK